MAVGAGIAVPLAALGLERTEAKPRPTALPDRPRTDRRVVRTAVAIGPGANVIDLSVPWEVFQDAAVARAGQSELFTVAQDVNPIDASGGLRIHPRTRAGLPRSRTSSSSVTWAPTLQMRRSSTWSTNACR
jgi:hypothetical protein